MPIVQSEENNSNRSKVKSFLYLATGLAMMIGAIFLVVLTLINLAAPK